MLPSSLETLGNYVFNLCKNLKSITLNEGLLTISNKAFNSCEALKTITIPSTVTTLGSKSTSSSSYASPFEGCTALTDVTFLSTDTFKMYAKSTDGLANSDFLPSSVTIHYYAGSSAEGFTSLGNKMVQMELTNVRGEGTWEGFTWKLLRDGTMTISGDGKMTDFKSTVDACHAPWYGLRTLIKELTFSEGFEAISAYSFAGASNLQSVSFPSTLTYIGKYAFSTCSSLDNLTIGANVELNDSCFQKCTSLKTLVFEEGRTSLTARVFAGCTALEEVVLPSTLETFGYNVTAPFNGCTGLKTITFLNKDVTIYPATDKFAANTKTALPAGVTLKAYAGGMVEQYANANGYTFVAIHPPFADDCTTVFEFTAGAVKAEAGLLPIVSLNRMPLAGETLTNNFLAVDENGALFAYVNGKAEALYDKDGNAILLADETKISIVYNDKNGTARVYVNGYVPFYGETLEAVAKVTAASEGFTALKSISDNLVLADGVFCDNHFTSEDVAAEFAGFQVSADTKSIRILAGINSLYYDRLGFTVELYSNGVLQGTRTEYTSVVFSSLLAEGNTVTAEELGFNYLTALKIENIDRTAYPKDADVYFVVKIFSMLGEEKLNGVERKIYVYSEDGKHEYLDYKRPYDGEFVPVLRFIASSDVHITDTTVDENDVISASSGAGKLRNAIEQILAYIANEDKNDGYAKLDALLLAGDIVNTGTDKQYQNAQYVFGQVKDGGILPNDTQLIITMGNHDWGNNSALSYNEALAYLAKFESVFGPATRDTVINGYHFITINVDKNLSAKGDNGANMKRPYGYDFSEETVAEAARLIEAAVADTPDKPVFVIQHVATSDTILGSVENYETEDGKIGKNDTSDSAVPTLFALQSKYPNLVVFSGHSHAPINDVASIHQEYFTSLNTGVLGGASSQSRVDGVTLDSMADSNHDNYDPNVTETAGNNDDVFVIEVDSHNRVRIRVWDTATSDFVGEEWMVDTFDPYGFKYTEGRYSDEDIFFAKDATISVDKSSETSVQVTFSRVDEDSLNARAYKLVATDKNGNEVVGYVAPEYYTADRTSPLTANLTGLTANADYTLAIYAINPMYSYDIMDKGAVWSAPLTTTFSTKAE